MASRLPTHMHMIPQQLPPRIMAATERSADTAPDAQPVTAAASAPAATAAPALAYIPAAPPAASAEAADIAHSEGAT